MPDVKRHLKLLDRLEPPELWEQIEHRTPRPDLPQAPSGLRKTGVIVLALFLAVGGTALVVRAFDGRVTTFAQTPVVPAENGLLVVSRTDKWGAHLYVVDPRNPLSSPRAPINLTLGHPEFDTDPAIFPDGTTVAFVRKTYDQAVSQAVWLIDIDGTHLRRFTDPTIVASDPAWSPDGSMLAYSTEQVGAHRVFASSVDTTSSEGTAGSEVTIVSPDGLDANGPTWSPDGRQIAYSVSADGTPTSADLYVTDLDSGMTRRLTETSGVGEVQPAWSPDGTRIAFTYTESNDPGSPYGLIAVMNADGGDLRFLTEAGSFDQRPAWSPDGRLIAFDRVRKHVSDRNPEDSLIVTVHTDGTSREQGLALGQQPAWQAVSASSDQPSYVGAFSDIRVMPAAWRLVVAYGSVWVTGSGGITRVDSSTGQVIAEIDVPQADESDIAAGAGHVWITAGPSIVGIDVATNRVDRSFEIQSGIRTIAFANDRLYVGHDAEGNGTLDEIDPITGAFGREVPTGGPGLGESAILPTDDAIWVGYSSPASSGSTSGLVRVSQDLSRADPVPGVEGVFSIAEAGGHIWAVGTGVLYEVDANGSLLNSFRIPLAGKVASDGQHLWLLTNTGSRSDEIYLPDPNVPARVVQIDTTTGALLDDGIALSHEVPANIAVGDGHVWVSFYDDGILTGVYG